MNDENEAFGLKWTPDFEKYVNDYFRKAADDLATKSEKTLTLLNNSLQSKKEEMNAAIADRLSNNETLSELARHAEDLKKQLEETHLKFKKLSAKIILEEQLNHVEAITSLEEKIKTHKTKINYDHGHNQFSLLNNQISLNEESLGSWYKNCILGIDTYNTKPYSNK